MSPPAAGGSNDPGFVLKCFRAIAPYLDDVEVGSVQLRLQNAAQGAGVLTIDGDDRTSVAVILCSVQDRQRVRKDRALELERIEIRA